MHALAIRTHVNVRYGVNVPSHYYQNINTNGTLEFQFIWWTGWIELRKMRNGIPTQARLFLTALYVDFIKRNSDDKIQRCSIYTSIFLHSNSTKENKGNVMRNDIQAMLFLSAIQTHLTYELSIFTDRTYETHLVSWEEKRHQTKTHVWERKMTMKTKTSKIDLKTVTLFTRMFYVAISTYVLIMFMMTFFAT